MKNGEKGIGIRRGDVFVLALLLLLTAALFAADRPRSGELYAVIYADGAPVRTVDLSAVTAPCIIEVGGCTLGVGRDGVFFTASDCPDGLCVRRGKMTHGGDSMACLPNRVAVTLRAKTGGADAVTY